MSFGFGMGFPRSASAAGGPTLNLQFAGNTVLDPRITFTRASSATLFDSTGTLVYAPMNAIRNNTMVGAVAGTPGTLPTNWTTSGFSGLTREIVGAGTFNGVNYIDIKYSGTASGVFGDLYFDGTTVIAAVNAQTWAESAWVQIVAGTQSGVTSINFALLQYDSGGVSLGAATLAAPSATVNTTWQRISRTGTTNNASTAFVRPYISVGITNGAAIDITLRIGMPQLELGSVARAVNATSGTAYQGPRFDYDPDTLAPRGLLIEEQRTNSIRNNTMQGAVAGTPGTLPTNWASSGTLGTLTRQIVGIGTVNGISYIDIKWSGTTSSTGAGISFESTGAVSASNGQTWSNSAFIALVGGSLTNINPGLQMRGLDAGNAVVQFLNQSITPSATFTRLSQTGTLSNATITTINAGVNIGFSSGVVVDFTLRIGLPQLELGAFATSVIPTTTTALTRNADSASMTGTNFSSWYNATEGTLFAEASWFGLTTNDYYAALNDGTSSNLIALGIASTNLFRFININGGVTDASITTGTPTVNAVFKHAGAYKLNDYAACVNGGSVGTDTSATVAVGLTTLSLNASSGTTNQFNGYLRRISYYPRRLSNTELQAITA